MIKSLVDTMFERKSLKKINKSVYRPIDGDAL